MTKPTADTALRLVLGDPLWAMAEARRHESRELIHVLRANRVLVRVARSLSRVGELDSELLRAAQEEEARVASTIRDIRRLASALNGLVARVVFFKALPHYPDMGTDIDILVDREDRTLDDYLIRALGAIPRPRTIASVVAGRRSYSIPGMETPVDIHHARLGLVGEHRKLAQRTFAHLSHETLEGVELATLTPENELALQTVQRLYAHGSLRASDVVHLDRLTRGPLDRAALEHALDETGLGPSCRYLSRSARRLVERARGQHVSGHLPSAGRYGYRLGGARIMTSYARNAIHALRTGDFDRAARIACLPPIAAVTLAVRASRSVAVPHSPGP